MAVRAHCVSGLKVTSMRWGTFRVGYLPGTPSGRGKSRDVDSVKGGG